LIDPTAYDLLDVHQREGVARVEVRHPPVNLIDKALFRELRHIVRDVSEDPDTPVFRARQ
jgi:enoyl-CoA hydratase/carnithine racemase